MSAAVNDRLHSAFSATAHLPLTGEMHPLRREFERLLAAGNAVAATIALLACTVVYFWPRPAEITMPVVLVDGPGDIHPSPPPIDPNSGGEPGIPAVAPEIEKANFEPVDDKDIPKDRSLTDPRAGEGDPSEPPSDGPIGPVSVDPSTPPEPVTPDYSWWDEAPVFLSIDPPTYPEMVRDAGIDGTVMVRVLIGVNGKVKDAYVVDGSDALREAALESARTAIFKAALQGVHPVEVWVVIPITFQLSGHH
jgi:protein TonB